MGLSVFVVSCEAVESQEVRCLHRLIRDSADSCIRIVASEEEADVVLVVDVKPDAVFQSLRRCPHWRREPEKCFLYSELDNPPSFLHGVCASVPKWKAVGRRFSGFHYPILSMQSPNPPPEHLQALSPERKRYLLSFVGKASHRLRKRLFRHHFSADCLIRRTDASYDRYNKWAGLKGRTEELSFWKTLAASRFALCPRGAGAASARLFEAMRIGVAPIIVSDDWIPPIGPDWDAFALVVPERSIGDVESVARAHQNEWQSRGVAAKRAWERFFRDDRFNAALALALTNVRSRQIIGERLIVRLSAVLIGIERLDQLSWHAKAHLRLLAIRLAAAAGLRRGVR